MGMQEKLIKQYIKGCNDTWEFIDRVVQEVPGVGPKTREKMMRAIKGVAFKEVESVSNLRANERKKVYAMIDEIGFEEKEKI